MRAYSLMEHKWRYGEMDGIGMSPSSSSSSSGLVFVYGAGDGRAGFG